MPLVFSQLRMFNSLEVPVTVNRAGTLNLPEIEIKRNGGAQEINSIKVEIIDNKPLYIPLGKTGLTYKGQFALFNILDFHVWYTVLGNDVLKVEESTYDEFPVGTYWNVESFTHQEMPGSTYAKSVHTTPGEQFMNFECELELTKSLTDAVGRPRV